jgi:hypothetical protein
MPYSYVLFEKLLYAMYYIFPVHAPVIVVRTIRSLAVGLIE